MYDWTLIYKDNKNKKENHEAQSNDKDSPNKKIGETKVEEVMQEENKWDPSSPQKNMKVIKL